MTVGTTDWRKVLEGLCKNSVHECTGCQTGINSGVKVFQESLYGDVVGCQECCEWVRPHDLPSPPEVCTNCGLESWEAGKLLMDHDGLFLACGMCCNEFFAAEVLGEVDDECP